MTFKITRSQYAVAEVFVNFDPPVRWREYNIYAVTVKTTAVSEVLILFGVRVTGIKLLDSGVEDKRRTKSIVFCSMFDDMLAVKILIMEKRHREAACLMKQAKRMAEDDGWPDRLAKMIAEADELFPMFPRVDTLVYPEGWEK